MTHHESESVRSDAQAVRFPSDVPPPLTPAGRLAASREALRAALSRRQPRTARRREAGESPRFSERIGDAFAKVPLSGAAVRWLQRWWRRHPLRPTFEFAAEAGDEIVRPVAENHPWLVVGGAFTVGMLLARLRPWRVLTSGALLAGLVPRFQVTSIIQWMTAFAQDALRQPSSASSETAGNSQQQQQQSFDPGPPASAAPAERPEPAVTSH